MVDPLSAGGLSSWDPTRYRQFETERDRAAQDLLARIPRDIEPREIWDLGCGVGAHAIQLKAAHQQASVHGLDASPDMLEQASAASGEVDWRRGDIAGWRPEVAADLILANASLHWVADHPRLFAALANALAPGGVLAVQMPLTDETLHHRILRDVAGKGAWTQQLAHVAAPSAVLGAQAYYDLLSSGCEVDIWSTTYLHVLRGSNAVVDWMTGAALRPYLSALEPDNVMTTAFLSALGERLSEAFPPGSDGATLLPFPRLFLVARRRSSGPSFAAR